MEEETKKQHSPTPWRVYNEFEIEDADENMVLFSTIDGYEDITHKDVEQAKADLAYILDAVNSHERLVAENARLRDLVRRMIQPVETTLLFAKKEGEMVKRICRREKADKVVDSCIAALEGLLAEARKAVGEEAANAE